MKTLQLGPFLLNTDLIMLILSVLFGYIGLSIRLNGYQTVQTFVKDKFSNALLLWLVIWKFSIIVFDPIPVIKAPLSLIYFNGGEDGMWLAGALSGIYLWSNLRKNLLSVAAMIEFAAITFFLWVQQLSATDVDWRYPRVAVSCVIGCYIHDLGRGDFQTEKKRRLIF